MKPLLLALTALPLFAAVLTAQQDADRQIPETSATIPYGLPSMPVGPDDVLYISVYDSPALSRTARVGSNGTIRLPLLKQEVKVLGMMPSEIEAAVSKELVTEQILVDPVVSVSVVEYKSRPISVIGAVKNPVTFQALPGTTILDAITRAGGLSELAGSDIIVTRHLATPNSKVSVLSQRIPAKALLEGKDDSLNLPLTGGEEVRIPEAGKFFVMGNVRKPGSFAIRDDNDITVLKAVALSEGLDKYAADTAYIIRREAPSGKQEVPVDLSKILQRKMPDIPLQQNDILYIPDNKSKRLTAGTLVTLLALGTAASSSLIYATR